MLTTAEQEQFVNLLDSSPILRDSIETLLNRKLTTLTFGQKVIAVHEFLEQGHSAAAVAQAARAIRDIQNLAQQTRGELSTQDRLALLESQLTITKEQLADQQLRSKELRKQLTNNRADVARAVNSGERTPVSRSHTATRTHPATATHPAPTATRGRPRKTA